VQAVESLFAAFPMFMVVNPQLGAPLLEPLLRAQMSPLYKLPYAMSDLGLFFFLWLKVWILKRL
jgi:hypothetical protein